MSRTAFVNASAVVIGPSEPGPVRRPTWDDLGVQAGVGVGIENGRVALIARDADLRDWIADCRLPTADCRLPTADCRLPTADCRLPTADCRLIDCEGRLITPGLVDCHTHAVFGKPRTGDQARRARGEDYKAIAAAGGGILSSVEDFRTRGEDELVTLTETRLRQMAALGTTTVEVKSGYGLALEHELKALRVIRRVAQTLPLTLVPTFLGAHEIPAEYRGGRRDAYIRLVIDDMLPAVAREKLARFCDVFCEPGVFALDETEAILKAAAGLGMGIKLHADELDPYGGAELAARVGAASADHLGAISSRGVDALAGSGTVAVLLPGTLTFLGKQRQAPARTLLEAGALVALATDFNPGSSPTGNLPLIMALGVSQAKMQPEEAFLAATANAAHALGVPGGRLAAGSSADLAVWNCRDVRELSYWYGMPLAWRVYSGGRPCHYGEGGITSPNPGAGPLSPP